MEQFRHWYLNHRNIPPFIWANDILTVEECAKITELAQGQEQETGLIEGAKNEEDTRKGTIRWLNSADPAQQWIFKKMTDVVLALNKQYYNYDLEYIEVLQFTEYHNIGDFYDDHMDFIYSSIHLRKLSFSLQLSDPNDYTGGNLEMVYGKKTSEAAPRTQGSITVFPSYQMHRVTPITSGKRTSLVGWVNGPPWK